MSTTLTYTKSAFVPFTKIVSSDMNTYFSDIRSRVNWAGGTSATTGLGDDNIQSRAASGGGLTRSTKLKAGTANYVVINGSSGEMTEEQYLGLARGGAGTTLVGAAVGDVPTYNGTVFAAASPIPIGSVFPYVGLSAPSGYLFCDGTRVSRSTYSALFAIIGETYGEGDNSTTFNLPDLRGMFVRGATVWYTGTITANASTDTITSTAGYVTRSGQPVRFSNSGGALPAGISAGVTYYTSYLTSTTLKIYTSEANALIGGGTGLVDITDAGSGTNSIINYIDPDIGSRTQATVGAALSVAPGSVQGNDFSSHTHGLGGFVGSVGAGGSTIYGDTVAAGNTVATGGNETRPRNLYFNHIIKY